MSEVASIGEAESETALGYARQALSQQVSETLRKLSFIMLDPLWEDAGRASLVQHGGAETAQLPDDWTPGSLPAFIAAPALPALVTFLAAEHSKRLAGITWDRQALLDDGKAEISAETLPWHLSAHKLLPRLKGIHRQRLYPPITGAPDSYPALHPVLTRPIVLGTDRPAI